MLLQRTIKRASSATVELIREPVGRIDEELRRIASRIGAHGDRGGVDVATMRLGAKLAIAVGAGTDRSAAVLRDSVLLAHVMFLSLRRIPCRLIDRTVNRVKSLFKNMFLKDL